MDKKALLVSLLAVVLSFAGGFLLANSINRKELNTLRTENERLKSNNAEAGSSSLSPGEIDAKIAEADSQPENFPYQKNLGIALYQYAAMKQDPDVLRKALPVLDRAASLNKDDVAVLTALGNAHFDIGYLEKDNGNFQRAREVYARVLKVKPDSAEVQTDLGLTYFLQDPQDLDAAVAELKKAIATDPKQEKALQFLVQALVKQNKTAEATQYLDRLKAAAPSDPSVAELATLIEKAKQQPAAK